MRWLKNKFVINATSSMLIVITVISSINIFILIIISLFELIFWWHCVHYFPSPFHCYFWQCYQSSWTLRNYCFRWWNYFFNLESNWRKCNKMILQGIWKQRCMKSTLYIGKIIFTLADSIALSSISFKEVQIPIKLFQFAAMWQWKSFSSQSIILDWNLLTINLVPVYFEGAAFLHR